MAMDVMEKLSDFLKSKHLDSGRKVVLEMEKVKKNFIRHTKQQGNIWTRKTKTDRVFALTLYPLRCYKEWTLLTFRKSIVKKEHGREVTPHRWHLIRNSYTHGNRPDKISHIQSSYIGDIENVKRDFHGQQRYMSSYNLVDSAMSLNPMAASYELKASNVIPTICQDMWRQLKRVQIPVFAGNKRNYQSWKAAFLAWFDSALATAEYKLLQLRQYLSGEALKVAESLELSASAYKAAK